MLAALTAGTDKAVMYEDPIVLIMLSGVLRVVMTC